MLEGIARPEPDNRMTSIRRLISRRLQTTKRGFNRMTLAQIEHLREKNKGLPKGWEAVFVNEGPDDGNPQFSLRYMRDGVLQVERPVE
jgi:hypothetical protein